VHALLLACLHRVAHHHNSQRLIWLYDIHLLLCRLSPVEHTAFVTMATEKRLRAICDSSLQLAHHCLSTPLPSGLTTAGQPGDVAVTTEATACFLHARRRWHDLWADLWALPGWSNKWQLLAQQVVPSPAYMLSRYATTRRTLLPALYCHRVLLGLWRLWQRTC
jgi:hypothetical protein